MREVNAYTVFFLKRREACIVGAAKYRSLPVATHGHGSPKRTKLYSTQCQIL